MKPVWEKVAGMVGQAFVGPVEVEVVVVVSVVVRVRALGVGRVVVLVSSRREIRVEVVFFVEVGPGQRGRDVGRGGM